MGYAGPVLRSQGSFGEDRLSRGAGGEGLIASNARSGPIPLRCGFMVLRGTGPALAGKLWRGSAFALCATEGLIASNARSGPIPLRPRSGLCLGRLGGGLFGLFFFGSGSSAGALVGSAGPCLRSQGRFGEDERSRGARGEGLIDSNARSGAVPRPLSSARAMGDSDLTVDTWRSCRDD